MQPILGKQILPWFGGTPAVWTTCLLFFQMLLLGGYLYAHGLSAWLAPRAGGCSRGAIGWLVVVSADHCRPRLSLGSRILAHLADSGVTGVHNRAPYFLISATGPLLQAWFSQLTLVRRIDCMRYRTLGRYWRC